MVNWNSFEQNLKNYFAILSGKNIDNVSKRIRMEYQLALISATNTAGQNLLHIDLKFFEEALKIAFKMQFYSKVDLKIAPYVLIANSIILSWYSAKLSPLPPIVPTVAPNFIPKSSLITYTGSSSILSLHLKAAMNEMTFIKTPELTAKFFTMAIRLHLKTISGLYNGLVPSPTGLIPSLPIPWVGFF